MPSICVANRRRYAKLRMYREKGQIASSTMMTVEYRWNVPAKYRGTVQRYDPPSYLDLSCNVRWYPSQRVESIQAKSICLEDQRKFLARVVLRLWQHPKVLA